VADNTVTRYLRVAQLNTAEVTLDRQPSSPRLDDSDRAILASLEEKRSRFVCARTCPSHPDPRSYRREKAHQIVRVRTTSSWLGAAPSLRRSASEGFN
jgi:hypothetical protein